VSITGRCPPVVFSVFQSFALCPALLTTPFRLLLLFEQVFTTFRSALFPHTSIPPSTMTLPSQVRLALRSFDSRSLCYEEPHPKVLLPWCVILVAMDLPRHLFLRLPSGFFFGSGLRPHLANGISELHCFFISCSRVFLSVFPSGFPPQQPGLHFAQLLDYLLFSAHIPQALVRFFYPPLRFPTPHPPAVRIKDESPKVATFPSGPSFFGSFF